MMGMMGQISASYIILVLIAVPGMVAAGIWPTGAHFFVVYMTMPTMVTPPIAFAVFSAAALANSNYWKTAWQACRLAIVAFIVPFMFVYQPAILLQGTGLEVLQALGPILVAITILSFGIEGYIYKIGSIGWPARAMLVAGGLLLIPPGFENRMAGAGLIVMGIVIGLLMRWLSFRRVPSLENHS